MRFAYLIGAPGSGKSTVAQQLRSMAGKSQLYEEPIPHMVQWRGGLVWYAELGRTRANFSGTDSLAMNAIDKAERFVLTHPYPRLFAEGDRLANDRFFSWVAGCGYLLECFWLDTPADVLAERRAKRAEKVGKAQNPTWLKGRDSKVLAMAERYGAYALPGEAAPLANAMVIKNYLS